MVLLKKIETQKIKALIILCGFLFFFVFPISNFFSSQKYWIDYIKNEDQDSSINTSGSWINTSLTIDATATSNLTHYGNWNWAVEQPWCSGLGTYQFPYIIENLSLSIGSAEYGLSIQNSRSVYFKLINVSAHGAIDEDEKGLYITNSSNGIVKICNFTSNYYGIYMFKDCDNFTLIENDLSDATSTSSSPIYHPRGLFLQIDCDFNLIYNNSVNKQSSYIDDGIYLLDFCDNNTIVYNNLMNVDVSSVYLGSYCSNNTISNNNLTGSLYGVDLDDYCSSNKISENYGIYNFYGIRIRYDSSHNRILENEIKSTSNTGIYLWDSYNNTIDNNELEDTGYYGITVQYYSNYNQILHNNISGATQHGIFISSSYHATVSENNMSVCGLYVSGTEEQVTSHLIPLDNTINGKPIYYNINQEGLDSGDFTNPGQIILANCSKSSLSNFVFTDVSLGIGLLYVKDSVVYNNIIQDCLLAFYLEDGFNNTIRNNDFSDNVAGIDLENSDFNYIYENDVNLNNNYGIWLGAYSNNNSVYSNTGINNILGGMHIRDSYLNTCFNNTFTGSNRGIELLNGDNNYLKNNIISGTTTGFLLQMGSTDNYFSGNNVSNCFSAGILLLNSHRNDFTRNRIMFNSGPGININDPISQNNRIYLNAFISNGAQDNGNANEWTNGGLGNYWSDYAGNDTNSDGVGDTPRFINPNGIDDRPLMYYPFTGEPPVLPEIFLQDYTLTNNSLTLELKNSGEENATGIKIIVKIDSIPLTLYDNSPTPFDLDIGETEMVFIDLIPFRDNFTWGDNYTIRIRIDPKNEIVEENELNNDIDIDYRYRPDLNVPDLLIDNHLLTADALWVYVNNTGNANATSVVIYAVIESLALNLYNNSLSPADIDINELFEVYINLSDYLHVFTPGETYNISLTIDPEDIIVEDNELNNQLMLEYAYIPSGPLPDLLIEDHQLLNNSLTLMVKNNGTSKANFVVIVIEIDSLLLILYNNSLNPVNISVDGILQINITLLDFESYFSNNTVYDIKVWLDYSNSIFEFDETNNYFLIIYHYIEYVSPPANYPDLVFQSYLLNSDYLTLVILNNGTDIALDIRLVVRINSLSLILFNNTISPPNLPVNDTTSVVLNLASYFNWFEDGLIYNINAQIDPLNDINELNELNNQIDIGYPYEEDEPPQPPPSIPWMLDFLFLVSSFTILFLVIGWKTHKSKL